MKISLRLQDDQDSSQPHLNPLVRAKIPVTIFNQPFTSSIATLPSSSSSSSSHLSFSLSSTFSAGPSLKLTYSHADPSPFSLSLKSGLGLFGSPDHSPLVFKAHFSLSHSNPTFFLHIKPQLGNFSLKKTTISDPGESGLSGSCSNGGLSNGSGLDGGFVNGSSSSNGWDELSLEPSRGKDVNGGGGSVEERRLGWRNGGKDGLFSGIAVMARTVLPLTKGIRVNMRWGVNFPAQMRSKIPYLTVNKIGIESVDEAKGEEEKDGGSAVGELEVLKGMCFSMRRYLEVLENENREIKRSLEDMKSGVVGREFNGERDVARRRVVPQLGEGSSEFERWRNRKSGRDENVRVESQLPVKSVKEGSSRVEAKKSTESSGLESELERAIKAATA